MARRRESASFDYAKRWLRKEFPSDCKVRIKLVDRKTIQGFDGYVHIVDSPNEEYVVVRIANDMNIHQTTETLWHEWAHVLMHNIKGLNPNHPHSPEFWVIYGRIYRKWHEE